MKNHLLLGNWNALCDSCGRKFKAFDLQKRWDGLMVCQEDFEQRHPQDLLKVQREKIAVPWSRPYAAEDTFIPENLWTKPEDHLGINETMVKNIVKRFGYARSDDTVNGFTLNSFPLNFTGTFSTPEETIALSENVLIVLARFLTDNATLAETFAKSITKRLSDTVAIAESLWFTEQEHNADTLSLAENRALTVTKVTTDTLSITESTTYLLRTLKQLNGAVLNTQSLG
jgi:hypothetical protein